MLASWSFVHNDSDAIQYQGVELMAPETRSRGAAPQGRVYHSTPALRQVHFRTARGGLSQNASTCLRPQVRPSNDTPLSSLKQQTLTQLEFVSSLEPENMEVVLSDSEAPSSLDDKENQEPSGWATRTQVGRSKQVHVEDTAALSGQKGRKRRRTVEYSRDGDEDETKQIMARQRRLNDTAPSSSAYHTQTLTQCLSHQLLVPDSEDDNDDEDTSFNDWLAEQASPSSRRISTKAVALARKQSEDLTMAQARQESIVPQTPAKRRLKTVIPSSSQTTSPPLTEGMLARYGPPGAQQSPSLGKSGQQIVPNSRHRSRPASLVICDSFQTVESQKTPAQTPTTAEQSDESPCRGQKSRKRIHRGDRTKAKPAAAPNRPSRDEIPDSDVDDDDGGFQADDEKGDESPQDAIFETQQVMHGMFDTVCTHETGKHPSRVALAKTTATSSKPTSSDHRLPRINQKSPSISRQQPINQHPKKLFRQPVQHPRPLPATQPQWAESQRVPASVLRSMPDVTDRSDILLRTDAATVDDVITGHQVLLSFAFGIPTQVQRLWLFDGDLLQWMACCRQIRVINGEGEAEPGPRKRRKQGSRQIELGQVYELNNPLSDADMRDEGWVHGRLARYIYIPPAIVGQLLWNLRHAVFPDDDDDDDDDPAARVPLSSQNDRSLEAICDSSSDRDSSLRQQQHTRSPFVDGRDRPPHQTASISVSQQVEEQIRSDIAHSTQVPPSSDVLVASTPDDEGRGDAGYEARQSIDGGGVDDGLAVAEPVTQTYPPPIPVQETPSRLHHHNAALSSQPVALHNMVIKALAQTPVRLSQATTASQASSPSRPAYASFPQNDAAAPTQAGSLAHDSGATTMGDWRSSSSITALLPPSLLLQDHDVDRTTGLFGLDLSASQLLSRSQMLSDSLLGDPVLPPALEIQDSSGE